MSSSSSEGCRDARDDVIVRLPLTGTLTYDEAHAALLGLVGLFAGVGYRDGYTEVVVGFTVVSFLVAFGYYRLVAAVLRRRGYDVPESIESKAAGTMRREAWYFSTVYVVTAAVGWVGVPF